MARGYRKLGRRSDHRRSMLRNLVTDLIINERLTTTDTRAKEVRSIAEKMITLGKRGDLQARRQVATFVIRKEANETQDAIQKLFSDIAPRFKERNGGYTRILKVGTRQGDAAPISIIEFVE